MSTSSPGCDTAKQPLVWSDAVAVAEPALPETRIVVSPALRRHHGALTRPQVAGYGPHDNGSLIKGDPLRVGARLGHALLAELERLGSTFVSGYVVERVEERFYATIGFTHNEGHLVYVIDKRPYANRGDA